MRKSTLFISATLTAFTLAILVGTASAYREIVNLKQPVVASAREEAPVQEISNQEAAPAPVASLTAEDAAAIAAKVIGRTDLYSVETTQLEGVDAFMVTFSSGDLVYIGMDGQVLLVSEIPVTTVVAQSSHRSGGGGSGQGSDGGDDHEGEHEDEYEAEHEDEPEHEGP